MMNHDEIIEQAVKVMHAEVCCPCDPQGCDWTHTREVRYARALAAAGLLARPLTTPTSAQEALDLGWNLAHPVKEGQVIPAGTRYLQWVEGNLREYTEHLGITVTKGKSMLARTVDPLPDPELDWFDAPAVLATSKGSNGHLSPTVWSRDPFDPDRWVTGLVSVHWRDLTDVTPLYPKDNA